MAIMRISNSGGTVGTNGSGVTVTGLEFITDVSIEESIGTIIKAKDGAGDVKAVLMAKSSKTLTASGYGTATEAPNLGLSVTGTGFTGKVIESSWDATAEDFTKISITAKGL